MSGDMDVIFIYIDLKNKSTKKGGNANCIGDKELHYIANTALVLDTLDTR